MSIPAAGIADGDREKPRAAKKHLIVPVEQPSSEEPDNNHHQRCDGEEEAGICDSLDGSELFQVEKVRGIAAEKKERREENMSTAGERMLSRMQLSPGAREASWSAACRDSGNHQCQDRDERCQRSRVQHRPEGRRCNPHKIEEWRYDGVRDESYRETQPKARPLISGGDELDDHGDERRNHTDETGPLQQTRGHKERNRGHMARHE